MLDNFIFSMSSALPIFMVMFIGNLLKRKKIIDSNFAKMANTLVFNVALPIKLFNDVFRTSIEQYFDLAFILFIVVGTILSVVVSWVIGICITKDKSKLGAFVHGSFRGNFLYIGLSLMENVTGSIGVKAPLVIAFIVPIYNILAVIIMTCTNMQQGTKISVKNILRDILRNPLIIAVLLGALASKIGITIPIVAIRTMSYFEVLATPLALITIGASFSMNESTANLKLALFASIVKLVVIPAVAVGFAIFFGFNNEDVLLVYILFGVPTATVSYIMTVAMNGDRDLSSNIIMITTLASNFTMTMFVFVFKTIGIV